MTNPATLAQNTAATPSLSTWVNANAGSGKTRVLTNRVARLLLHGTDPQRILCLTYTNAAAAEMQTRLFAHLGSWAMLGEDDLRETLESLGEDKSFLDTETLNRARRLFANALETPGGLKIQTIHAFCDSLLRRFPMESGVSPHFKLMEERDQRALRSQVLEQLAQSPDAPALEILARFMTDLEPDDLLAAIQKHKKEFARIPTPQDFGLNGNESLDSLIAEFLSDDIRAFLTGLIEPMIQGKATDQKNSAFLNAAMRADSPTDILNGLKKIFLTGTGEVRKKLFPTQAVLAKGHPAHQTIATLAVQFGDMYDSIKSIQEYARTRALHDFARAYLTRYQNAKTQMAALDYDDLILLAERLLTLPEVAPWVLYRLDAGLEHILVDESQDTSPRQWQIIQTLHSDFTDGASANLAQRTLFVVGDEKQSIYSFQGADPEVFTKKKNQFQTALQNVGEDLQEEKLLYSFRTGPAILGLVDRLFATIEYPPFNADVNHKSFYTDKNGRVDLWPFIEKNDSPEMPKWFEPLAAPSTEAPHLTLAEDIATQIKTILANPPLIEKDGCDKPLQAGDILILLRRRSPLFHAIIKELKKNGLAVSGADSFKIKQELAVCDILSLLHFALLPSDNLSLAEALRSPLFNLSEQDLFALAYGRDDKTLWQVLQEKQTAYQSAHDILRDILAHTDFLRPYEMIERILIHHGGRKKMIARLGEEIEDALDELLAQALKFETSNAASLSGFLQWFAADDLTIKRALDGQLNQIRVMTIHGAKGLESPLVILPDTAERRTPNTDKILKTDTGMLVWASRKDEASQAQLALAERNKQKREQEELRLLYVAMTRAESWLIVCGAGSRGQSGETWYDLVETAMRGQSAIYDLAGQTIQRLETGDWQQVDAPDAPAQKPAPTPAIKKPNWTQTKPASRPRPAQPLSPSRLLPDTQTEGAIDIKPSEQEDLPAQTPAQTAAQNAAKSWGLGVHLLLEHLPNYPPDQWQGIATALLSDAPDPDQTPAIIKQATNLLGDKTLAFLFGKNSRAEIGITAPSIAPLLKNHAMRGYIDRLIIDPTRILAVDYKSHSTPPTSPETTPDSILAQMGAYHYGLGQIYPDRDIETAILWTRTATLMPLPKDLIYAALEKIKPLDLAPKTD